MSLFSKGAKPVPTDPRTSSARALDDFIPFARRYVPDRIPEGVDPLVLANPSTASFLAAEIARRITDELGEMPGFHNDFAGPLGNKGLGPILARLPRELLAAAPAADVIRAHCDEIDRRVNRIRNPPVPAPHSAERLELAADLGVKLPPEHDQANALLAGAIAARNHGDTRYRVFFENFIGWVAHGGALASVNSCLLRRILVEAGMPPLRKGSVFERTDDQLGFGKPPAVADEYIKHGPFNDFGADRPVEDFVQWNGGTFLSAPASHVTDTESRAKFERCLAQRRRQIAGLDALAATLPIGAARYFARELRREFALDPGDKPAPMHPELAGLRPLVRMFQAFSLKIDLSEVSR